ncbi:DNA repair protein RadC [Aquirufa sp. HETE-83D]|uniref:DNA repair protein RadC n=1 Tax=Aquirufa esocilacus TaxID=3096513 RepID=A0ABW6DH62_9BACT
MKTVRKEDMPREKLARLGASDMSLVEILTILIGSGFAEHSAADLAQLLLNAIDGDLCLLARYNYYDFKKLKGIGPAKGALLVAALELGRRRQIFESSSKQVIRNSIDAYSLIKPYLADLIREEFWVFHLNRASTVVLAEKLSIGGVAGTTVDIRLLYKSALERLTSSIILAHNHPSNQMRPSRSDIELTKQVVKAGRLFGIDVVDHLIVGASSFYSFADEGKLN